MKRYVVTGASGGIGRAVAVELAGLHTVIACVRSAERAPTTSAQILEADLSKPATLSAVFEGLAPVDGVVHCAGLMGPGRLADLDVDAWQQQLTVNVTAAAEITRLLLPGLRSTGGTVMFLNSGAGQKAHSGLAAYGASKFALRALADYLRLEEPGLRVTTLYPGPTRTPMQAGLSPDSEAGQSPNDCLDPATVAAAVAQILAAPDAVVVPEVTLRPRANP